MNKTIAILVLVIVAVIAIGSIVYVNFYKGTPVTTANTTTTQPKSTTMSTNTTVPILRVGTSPDYPPFEYIDQNGSIVGFDIDLVNMLAQKLGYKVQIVSISFDGLIPALVNNQIDLIAAGMTITPERQKVVSFTIPYFNNTMSVMIPAGSSFVPKSLDDLVGKTVGCESGTTGEMMLRQYVNSTGKIINIKPYDNFILVMQDLENKRIDAAMVDTTAAKEFVKKYNVAIAFTIDTGQALGLAVRKSDTDLLNKLNSALTELINSPDWDKLVSKYFG